jgi:spermidine/putrescine transport system ATP-binding protein
MNQAATSSSAIGTLYERPASAYVAGFLGVSNLLPATIGDRGDYVARLADGTVRCRRPWSLRSQSQIGAGEIRLNSDMSAIPERMNRLEGRVIDASYLGASTSYIIESKAGERLTVFEQNVERTSHSSLHRPGDDVLLSWSPDHTFAVGNDGAAPTPASATA